MSAKMLSILSQTINFRLLQTQNVCRRQYKLDENGIKFSKWVENAVRKGEIACITDMKKQWIV